MPISQTNLLDIATLAKFVYGKASKNDVVGQWNYLDSSAINTINGVIGFEAEAFQNTSTHEIVIAIRGTYGGPNYLEDLLLGGGLYPSLNPFVAASDAFAEKVARAHPNATITVTGHSLGGYAAQATTLDLLKKGLVTPSNLNTVTFNSPGLTLTYVAAYASQIASYNNGYNFYTQGDLIRLFDLVVGASANKDIELANSVSDSLIGGSGYNTVWGGTGNNVITVNGIADAVILGCGFNTVNGGSGKDYITAAGYLAQNYGGNDLIIGHNGTDVILGGQGSDQIFAGAQTNLTTAIANATLTGASGVQGDLISVLDGNSTIVGGLGNDALFVGSGNNVIVMGPGQDTFTGGVFLTSAGANWGPPVGNVWQNVFWGNESFTNPFAQPYNGNHYSVVGSGVTYTYGPGNDTIIGGSRNPTIYSANAPVANFAYVAATLENNDVYGGTGSDVICGRGAGRLCIDKYCDRSGIQ